MNHRCCCCCCHHLSSGWVSARGVPRCQIPGGGGGGGGHGSTYTILQSNRGNSTLSMCKRSAETETGPERASTKPDPQGREAQDAESEDDVASNFDADPREFGWRLHTLCEDGKYSEALWRVQAFDGNLDSLERNASGVGLGTALVRLCYACDAEDQEAELRFPLIKACIDKGSNPHGPLGCSPFVSAFENADVDTVRFLLDSCGAHMRGKDASKLIEYAQEYIRDVRENGPPCIFGTGGYFHSPNYISDMETIVAIFRSSRARQNWRTYRVVDIAYYWMEMGARRAERKRITRAHQGEIDDWTKD